MFYLLSSWQGSWQFSVLFIAITQYMYTYSTGLSSYLVLISPLYTMDTIRRIIFHHHFRKKPKTSVNLDTYRGKQKAFQILLKSINSKKITRAYRAKSPISCLSIWTIFHIIQRLWKQGYLLHITHSRVPNISLGMINV